MKLILIQWLINLKSGYFLTDLVCWWHRSGLTLVQLMAWHLRALSPTIWWHRSGLTLVQLMAWYLTAPSQASEVVWHSLESKSSTSYYWVWWVWKLSGKGQWVHYKPRHLSSLFLHERWLGVDGVQCIISSVGISPPYQWQLDCLFKSLFRLTARKSISRFHSQRKTSPCYDITSATVKSLI